MKSLSVEDDDKRVAEGEILLVYTGGIHRSGDGVHAENVAGWLSEREKYRSSHIGGLDKNGRAVGTFDFHVAERTGLKDPIRALEAIGPDNVGFQL